MYATSKAELDKRLKEEEASRKKREVKRTMEGIADDFWSCETSYEWKDLGTNHYPRFVRTAVCRSATCANGLSTCRSRDYSLKVLKRNTVADEICDDGDDDSLPDNLKSDWRLVTVKIIHCCDCSNRIAAFL
jgi:hypothetical protein